MMADVNTGTMWTILKSKKKSEIVNGFDHVKQPLAQVLSSGKAGKSRRQFVSNGQVSPIAND